MSTREKIFVMCVVLAPLLIVCSAVLGFTSWAKESGDGWALAAEICLVGSIVAFLVGGTVFNLEEIKSPSSGNDRDPMEGKRKLYDADGKVVGYVDRD